MTKTPTLSYGRAVVSALADNQAGSSDVLDPIAESYSLSSTELDVLLNLQPLQNNSAEFYLLKKYVELQKECCDDLLLSIQYRRSGLMEYCLQRRGNRRPLWTYPFGVKSDHSSMSPQHEETDPLILPTP